MGSAGRLVVGLVTYFIIFMIASLVAFAATKATLVVANRVGAFDQPGPRTFHKVATPRLGGIGIIVGLSLPIVAAFMFLPQFRAAYLHNSGQLNALIIAGLLIMGLGLYDDLFGANAWKKLIFQSLAAAVLVQAGFVFDKVSLLGFTFDLNGYAWLATIIWIVAIINAVNFIDGMDGLAATISLTLAVVFAVISLLESNFLSFLLMVALAGSLTGFLPFNHRPAKIFMGDTGSMFLGLLLATVTVAGNTKTPASIALAGPMLALALPVLDTIFVVRGRLAHPGLTLGERVFKMFNADRSHFHHRLYSHFGSEAKVVGTLWLLTALFGVASILTVIKGTRPLGYVVALGAVLLIVILRMVSARAFHTSQSPQAIERMEKRWTSYRSALSLQLAPARAGADRSATAAQAIAGDLRSFIVPHGYEPDQDEDDAYVEESVERMPETRETTVVDSASVQRAHAR